MNIPEAIKQLEDLYSVFCEVDAVEIIVADTKALEVAIEVLKEKSVKNQVELNKEIRRQRIISYSKQRTAQEVPVQEQLVSCLKQGKVTINQVRNLFGLDEIKDLP